MLKLANKNIFKTIGKAFTVPEPPKASKAKKNSEPEPVPATQESEAEANSAPTSADGGDEQNPVTEDPPKEKPLSPEKPKGHPKPRSPKNKIAKPKVVEYVPLETLYTRRRSKLGPYLATLEYSKYKGSPREFVDEFLRNALMDKLEHIYFLIKNAPPHVDPKLINSSVEKIKSDIKDKQLQETIPSIQAQMLDISGQVGQLMAQKAQLEKAGAKLIRQKKKMGEPTNSKEKREKKARVAEIKSMKAELNLMIQQIDKLNGQLEGLKVALSKSKLALGVISSIRHTSEDGRVLQTASFSSWAGDFDCRGLLSSMWHGLQVPLLGTDKTFSLVYRPSSVGGIILFKFIFPYAEEGNWETILRSAFLQLSDTIVDKTKSMPVKTKKQIPDLNDPFYVYVILTLGLDQIPPAVNENFPSFALHIKSNVKQCELCSLVSHQQSKCPKNERKRISIPVPIEKVAFSAS